MAQQVKNLALSLKWLGLLLWHRFVRHAAGAAKKKKIVYIVAKTMSKRQRIFVLKFILC